MKTLIYIVLGIVLLAGPGQRVYSQTGKRTVQLFTKDWKFYLGDDATASTASYDDGRWRSLDLPHDWSIELPFDEKSPTGIGGGALRGGTGWYRKTFVLAGAPGSKHVFIDFDGVYRNSEVWINGHSLGMRPNGYISFRYDLTPWLHYGNEKNVIAVRVDNSKQPNSRWYSGSGIYRNVWLVTTADIAVDHWGMFVSTPKVSQQSATVHITTAVSRLASTGASEDIVLTTTIYDKAGQKVTQQSAPAALATQAQLNQSLQVANPHLWSVDDPYLYKAVAEIRRKGVLLDEYSTSFGIRYFEFDINKGFSLNGKHLKINGVCNHHDLGCLGAAINTRALQRQLEILKAMGCNGIRTSHNPPAPELLDLCDKMGFIVMDEAFDMWKKEKNPYDYHLDWDAWHERDLRDQLLRDRNHPSVFIWSIGNEVNEQWDRNDTSGTAIARELVGIVKSLDTTRPATSALSSPYPYNPVVKADALDLIGYNYENKNLPDFHQRFPGKKFIGTETASALETRGFYDRSDTIRRWPYVWDKPFTGGNADHLVSGYDNTSAPWGSTHEETWKMFKKYDFLSGQYIWTGFDYIGEPTPYGWPSRSSYFGIIDLAGFPKDVYYMYQSEWTGRPVLHLVPDHWSWKKGDSIDVWAYYNNADEVELYLNGQSLGVRRKQHDDLHVEWGKVAFASGSLKAVSRKNGKTVLTEEIKTAAASQKLVLKADRAHIRADGRDLSFVTVKVTDKEGNFFPSSPALVKFTVTGEGFVAGVDNGSETSMESFKASQRTTFNGLCLLVVQSKGKKGTIHVKAVAEGMAAAEMDLVAE